MKRIDFRSDTVTWPTPTMREAMANAAIGDDVYGEDPTMNKLEAQAAVLTQKEAGLFVTSGTQGNLVSLLAHAGRGDEVIVGEANHTYNWEAGGMAVLGGIVPRVLPADSHGRMDLNEIENSIRADDPHFPRSRVITLETTAGGRYGIPLALDYLAAVRALADKHHLLVHLDGARVFNAAVALDVPVSAITQYVDSMTFCLSKGLCAPVGSVVVGTADFIHKARRARKLVGGGMRQAGFMAAAGIVALDENIERLADDHRHAKMLAAGLATIPGIVIDPATVYTNMVFFSLDESVALSSAEVAEQLRERANIWIGAGYKRGDRNFRAVTHYWIGEPEIEALLTALRGIDLN